MTIDTLLEGHRRFRSGDFGTLREQFRRLVRDGQHPAAMLIGCSDSRVIPELFTGAGPGSLFVVRNIANVVPPPGSGDTGIGAAIEYAVAHLHVPAIIVCGHYECGGIKALDESEAFMQAYDPHLAAWLGYARAAGRTVDARGAAEENRHHAVVEENVLLQLEHLQTYTVIRDAVGAGSLGLHGWVYDIANGVLRAYNPSTRRFEEV